MSLIIQRVSSGWSSVALDVVYAPVLIRRVFEFVRDEFRPIFVAVSFDVETFSQAIHDLFRPSVNGPVTSWVRRKRSRLQLLPRF